MTSAGTGCGSGKPSISLVTICLNQAAYVSEAIRSVLEQRYPELQYIIVDGGSVDGSRGVIERYAGASASLVFEPDAGPADALNKGLERATGEIFGYLNADDMLLAGALDFIGEQFLRNPNADILVGDGFELDATGEVTSRLYSGPWSKSAFKYGQCPIVQPATFIRRSALRRVAGFNIENRTCWDGELVADLVLAGATVKNLSRPIAAFRLHAESISGSGRRLDAYRRDTQRIFRKLAGRDARPTDRLWMALFMLRRISLRPGYITRRLVRHQRKVPL